MIYFLITTPWSQDVNGTYIRCSEDVQDILKLFSTALNNGCSEAGICTGVTERRLQRTNIVFPQSAVTCSKLTIETLEKVVKYVQT